MLSSLKQYSYDAFAVGSLIGFGVFVVSSVVLSPLYATPVFAYSTLKTAYHAARFFHFQKYPDQYVPGISPTNYKNKNFRFKKIDLDNLKTKLQAFEHKEKRDEYWIYSCKVAKGFIPVIGFIWLALSKTPMTSLKPEDTWSDANALRYHIRKINLLNLHS